MSALNTPKSRASVLLGSAFLMATSAIGPGFITQTTVFTAELRTSFGFIILCSILLDIVVQLNIWRVVSVSGMRAHDLANAFVPGLGYVLSVLIVAGGLAFNIGNVAGAGLGLQVLLGVELWQGVIISAILALVLFWFKHAGKALDLFSKILGIVMILLMVYIVYVSHPPVADALVNTFRPEVINTTAIIVLVGGTVGGYISFAGVHRLLDDGIAGPASIREVSRSSVKGILLASAMRVLLFLAALGVVMAGGVIDAGNPAASVFRLAAGEVGYRIFGLVLWCAAITSVAGSAYTSVSFLRSFHPFFERYRSMIITFFILFSAVIFLIIGRPVTVLVVVGALNAFVLPLALGIILLVAQRSRFMGTYRHPLWLTVSGWVAVALVTIMSLKTVVSDLGAM